MNGERGKKSRRRKAMRIKTKDYLLMVKLMHHLLYRMGVNHHSQEVVQHLKYDKLPKQD